MYELLDLFSHLIGVLHRAEDDFAYTTAVSIVEEETGHGLQHFRVRQKRKPARAGVELMTTAIKEDPRWKANHLDSGGPSGLTMLRKN